MRSRTRRGRRGPVWQRSVAAALLVLLVVLSYFAVRWGAADLYAKEGRFYVEKWEKVRKAPPINDWRRARHLLETAAELEPLSPNHREALGQIYDWRVYGRRSETLDVFAFREQSLAHFLAVASRRPVSPYSWANIALAKMKIGQTDDEFANAIRRAALLGPWEPGVQIALAGAGFSAWERLPVDVQQLVVENVQRGAKRQAEEMLRLATAYGRQPLICMRRELIETFKPRWCI